MSYIKDPSEAIPDLLRRREFIALRGPDKDPSKDSLRKHGLMLNGNQVFCENFMNPHTPYTRLLLKRSVGTGKTVAALVIAREFIKAYRVMREHDGTSPTVFVVAFTKEGFRQELLRKPELGSISRIKYDEYVRLYKLAVGGLPVNIAKYNEYLAKLKREQTDARMGGFYQFYGYQELVNRLFTFTANAVDADVFKDGVDAAIAKGTVKLNESFMKRFENSLLICDEIHDVYNSLKQNNYGIAIQYLLDHVNGLRAVFASATIINNSPTEIIDLFNIMIPRDVRIKLGAKVPEGSTGVPLFDKSEFFVGKRLKPGAADRIGLISRGYVSTVLNVDTFDFPTRMFRGDPFYYRSINPVTSKSEVNLLPIGLVRCKMSPKHAAVYDAMIRSTTTDIADESADVSESSSVFDLYTLRDMVFPMPIDASTGKYIGKPADMPATVHYTTVRTALSGMMTGGSHSYIKLIKENMHTSFSGDFLRAENIGEWSAKYKMLLNMLDSFLSDPTSGKIMIYHNFVGASGVILLRELLYQNGFISDNGLPTGGTRCAVCGVAMDKHPQMPTTTYDERLTEGYLQPPLRKAHAFTPARVITIIGETSVSQRSTFLIQFNQPQNAWGEFFKIILVSKVFTQSYEAFAVQQMIITAMPFNVPTLTQVTGRAIRKGGHRILPPQYRNVNIYALVSSVDGMNATVMERALPEEKLSREERVYIEKFTDFEEIKVIDKCINENVLDPMFKEIVEKPDALDPLPYIPKLKSDITPTTSEGSKGAAATGAASQGVRGSAAPPGGDRVTFNAFSRYRHEISLIIWIIKNLFLYKSPVWTYETLLAAVRDPPFKIEYDCATIVEPNFAIALTFLTRQVIGLSANIDDERFIMRNGRMLHIIQVGTYFVLSSTRHLSYDSFERGTSRSEMAILTSEQIIDTVHGGFFEQQFKDYLRRVEAAWDAKRSDAPLSTIWGVGDMRFYTTMWRRYIEKSLQVPQRLIKIFDEFGVFIYAGPAIAGYKVLRKHMILKKQGWETVNIQLELPKENDVVGFYAPIFKLRATFLKHGVASDARKKGDRRLVKKGLACPSHAKDELMKIANALGVSRGNAGSTKTVCAQIEDKLLALEYTQRKLRAAGAQGARAIRYVYLPTEAMP